MHEKRKYIWRKSARQYTVVEGLSRAFVSCVCATLSFTVVLLVASIPLAIEIVTTTTLALGSKELVHEGSSPSQHGLTDLCQALLWLAWQPSKTWLGCPSYAPTRLSR